MGVLAGLIALQAAGAALPPRDPFAELAPLAEEALSEARGGFAFAGYEIEFGIVVEAGGAPTRTVVTDLTSLHAALEAAGLPTSRYPAASVTTDGRGVTIIRNAADGVTVSQAITLDVVIGAVPTGADGAAARGMMADLPLPGTFGSF